MKTILSFVLALFLTAPSFGIQIQSYAGARLGDASKIRCGAGAACSVAGGVASLNNGIVNQIASTTTTLTASQCGATVVSNSADTVSLPQITSSNLGCRFAFVVGDVSELTVNPHDSQIIAIMASAAGDAIRADAIGESVVLEAISVSYWAPVGAPYGTWTDVN